MKKLVSLLNQYRDEYYNQANPSVTDAEYDKLYDQLQTMERETGIVMANSPTHSVGFSVNSALKQVRHAYPMLSLDKTKKIEDIKSFIGNQKVILMWKMDGLTVCLTYRNGKLFQAETRGDGIAGELITDNAKTFSNIPLQIPIKDEVVVIGEAYIDYQTFEYINKNLPDNEKYKTPRNLCSGSVRQLDSGITAKRNVSFRVFNVAKGCEDDSFRNRFAWAESLGFQTVYNSFPMSDLSEEDLTKAITNIRQFAADGKIPIDGIVVGYDSVSYGSSLGRTEHHPKNQIAFKFDDEVEDTVLTNIEWQVGRSGVITPIAVFNPVELDGTSVSRASLHNLSIFYDLKLGIGDRISVYKANQIIPQVKSNYSQTNTCSVPLYCPECKSHTVIKSDGTAMALMCINPECKEKLVQKFSYFVSKSCMDIKGLSESTIRKLVDLGWLHYFADLYWLEQSHGQEMENLEGFGKQSCRKLFDEIENSKNVKLERFIAALGIPTIGLSSARLLAQKYHGNWWEFEESLRRNDDYSTIDGFGNMMNQNIHQFFDNPNNIYWWQPLTVILSFVDGSGNDTSETLFTGKNIVITGTLSHWKRSELSKIIETMGGHSSNTVSNNTDILIVGDKAGSKLDKAKKLGITIMNEDEVLNVVGG